MRTNKIPLHNIASHHILLMRGGRTEEHLWHRCVQ